MFKSLFDLLKENNKLEMTDTILAYGNYVTIVLEACCTDYYELLSQKMVNVTIF